MTACNQEAQEGSRDRYLEEAMARGEFREDLYYRVNVVEIRVAAIARAKRRDPSAGIVAWPPAESLWEIARRAAREAEREALKDVLAQVHWNRAAASRILKVSSKTLLHRPSTCGLTPPLGQQSETPRGEGPSR